MYARSLVAGALVRQPAKIAVLGALALVSESGCFRPDDGREPPLDRIYFPTGLALSGDASRLYIANSNWDLQFNAGSVQAYDATALRELLPQHCASDADCESGEQCHTEATELEDGNPLAPTFHCMPTGSAHPCGERGLRSEADRARALGLCNPIDNRTEGLLLDSVGVRAFATDLIYREGPEGQARLFVPVRSDATLTWMDVEPGAEELTCGQETQQGRSGRRQCDDEHRAGDERGESTASGDTLPIEPFGVGASEDGTAIVTSHQTQGKVALFHNDWSAPDQGPRLVHVLENLPFLVAAVSPIPQPAAAESLTEYQPGFWVTSRGSSLIQLLRYFDGTDSLDGTPFLRRTNAARILTTNGADVRGMAVDDSRREACEASCDGDAACLLECASVALDVFLANRAPSSLLIGRTVNQSVEPFSNDRLTVTEVVPAPAGPSRVALGDVTIPGGRKEKRVFLLSFDEGTVTIFQPTTRRLESQIQTGRGPSAIVIDGQNALAYVAHFTDSHVSVIDLDARFPSYGTVLATLGQPTPPRGDR